MPAARASSTSTSASGSSSSIATSTAKAHVAGNTLIAFIAGEGGPRRPTGLTDTALDLWEPVPGAYRSFAGATNPEWGDLWMCRSTLGNAANLVTAALDAAATFRSIHVHEYSGLDTVNPCILEAGRTIVVPATSIVSNPFTSEFGCVGVAGLNPELGPQASYTPGQGFVGVTTETTAARFTADFVGMPQFNGDTVTIAYPTSCDALICLALFRIARPVTPTRRVNIAPQQRFAA